MLHVYLDDHHQKLLVVELKFELLQRLEPVLDALQTKTGVQITEYDDVALSPEHSQLLIKLINEHNLSQALKPLMMDLQKAVTHHSYIYFVGE
ncbi:hypothetical protein [Candidatus Albibeggiatoa sp. nov. NOAA]|uniref:hypothetical protein n=1 Tax=Candidatus Albibeggiatoa sp. nov. NOAA TaxID=3162724 RepID=UPI0032F96CC4|nr:hypothetical protein [Thiotrichaceae bacterium]